MHRTRPIQVFLSACAVGLFAPAALATPPAASLCPATPPAQPAAYVAHIQEINHGLGIPPDYAAQHHLRPQPEARDLVQVPRDVYGRKVKMVVPAAVALKAMFAAAARDGVKLETVSGFRSMAYQTHLVRAKLKRGMTIQKALTINAVPGYSEHQTGCAIDLTTPGVPAADSSFAKSKAFTWLQKHAVTFGFHLSFPPGNPYGYEYEPWHWRYIAVEAPAASSSGH
ncbi:MAG TPA: M15 family metallopeptidase [Rhodanobacteraceae bacterium]|jgi:D-alanyl-D-alanine carboxypeptidase|nr:M15 family metallopeptidase [Rhodanobacteraceae bacterium]